MNLKNIVALISLLVLSFSLYTCKSPAGPANKSYVSLSLENVSCTEAWLKVNTGIQELPVRLTIKSDDYILFDCNITASDSTIYIDSLKPNKTYELQGTYKIKSEGQKTNKLAVTTMDTTSNNFTWQTFTFGGNAGSCLLNDVAIVNDTIAYAVGSVYLKDSTGQPDPNAFCVSIWNGNEWYLNRIYDSNNNLIPNVRGIYMFNGSNIWLADGGVYRWDGVSRKVDKSFDRISLIGGNENGQSVNKIWGTNPNNLYGVGNKGMITFYNGNTWQKIESGTRTDINDIWGYVDPNTGQSVELCAVSFVYSIGDYKILKIQDNKVDSLKWNMRRGIHSIWTKNGFPIYAVGDGVFNNSSGHWKEEIGISSNYKESIRGTGLNDIYVCGDFGLFAHFNGIRWKVYKNLAINGIYTSLAVKGNLVIAVGTDNGKAIIVMGRRN